MESPCAVIVAGPSQCGKSTFVLNLIRYADKMFNPVPTKIMYCYSLWQDAFEPFKHHVNFVKGFPSVQFTREKHTLLILDDLIAESSNDQRVADLFTRGSHHLNITVILITQNLFFQGKCSRNISLNSQYIILFKNPRDVAQLSYLAKQMYPGQNKVLLDAYKLATRDPRGYLLVDCRVTTGDDQRLRSRILPFEAPEILFIRDEN